MDVRVVEAGEDTATAQVDAVRAGQSGLVRADPAGDPIARDRERAGDGQRRLHRPDDAVLQDHPGDSRGRPEYTWPAWLTSR